MPAGMGFCGNADGRRRAFQRMRIDACGRHLVPGNLAFVAAKLRHLEGKVLPGLYAGDFSLNGKGVIEFIRQIAALPADFDRAAFDVLSVVLVGFLIVALDDLKVPTGLGLRLGSDEAFRQLDLHFRGGKSAIAAMRHLKCGNDGAFLFGRTVNEGRMGEGLRRRDGGDEQGAGDDLGGFHLFVLATAAPLARAAAPCRHPAAMIL
ncbi:hypothetical protein D3C87_1482230 [compost metagenome]